MKIGVRRPKDVDVVLVNGMKASEISSLLDEKERRSNTLLIVRLPVSGDNYYSLAVEKRRLLDA